MRNSLQTQKLMKVFYKQEEIMKSWVSNQAMKARRPYERNGKGNEWIKEAGIRTQ